MKNNREKIIFFGNGPLADFALKKLEQKFVDEFYAVREKARLLLIRNKRKDAQKLLFETFCRHQPQNPNTQGCVQSPPSS